MTPQTPTRPTVLYVEDDEGNIEVAELRLGKRFRLLVARTDQEACALIRAEGDALQAILMDVELKGSTLDGLALTRLVRGRPVIGELPAYAQGLPQLATPVFVVTAYAATHPPPMIQEAGADSYFAKPVDFVKLSLAIAGASARAVIRGLGGPSGP